ncbi:TIR domain-containing protein [Microbacterium sp. BH-3-3-3]|uniref:TIR domain-containing protein n=1 Tax=Microbacterium sp. BH-3-3-3 TaxID=1906742 RepID=UPI0011A3D533|nr:nucleotide-binding protein [Microbacterium sp. BH-3-3-3]
MTKFSGAIQQSLAQFLEREATHSLLDSLYLRYEIGVPTDRSMNKLQKANYLVGQLNRREKLDQLISYISTPASGMSRQFGKGSPESQDFWQQMDGHVPSPGATPPVAAHAPRRQFARPGTSAPEPRKAAEAHTSRYVFVVHGRDTTAHKSLVAFLTSLDLRVVTWDEATTHAGGGTPHTLDIVRAGIDMSDAVVVLMTPDDLGYVKHDFFQPGRDDPREASPSGQARQNVIFEAGWAMALRPDKVVLVRIGDVRPLSDIDGLNYVWLRNDVDSRRALITRLINCELAVHQNHEGWRTAGTFPEG